MRLGTKLFLTTSVIIVALVALSGWSLLATNRLVEVSRDIVTRALPALRLEMSLRQSLDSLVRLEARALLLREAEFAKRWSERAAQAGRGPRAAAVLPRDGRGDRATRRVGDGLRGVPAPGRPGAQPGVRRQPRGRVAPGRGRGARGGGAGGGRARRADVRDLPGHRRVPGGGPPAGGAHHARGGRRAGPGPGRGARRGRAPRPEDDALAPASVRGHRPGRGGRLPGAGAGAGARRDRRAHALVQPDGGAPARGRAGQGGALLSHLA